MLHIYIYIYDISSLRVNDLTCILLTWRKGTPNNASKWQMGFNSAFKGLNITYCVCLCYAACNVPASYCRLWPVRLSRISPHYLLHGTIKKCVLIFYTTFVLNISDSKKNWVRYDHKMYIGLHIKNPLFLSDCSEAWIFSTFFRKNTQISNFMKVRPVGGDF